MKTLVLAFLALAGSVTAAPPPAPAPERVVDGTTVISARQPRMHVTVPETARYLGAERWNLYDIADCEIHVFVDAGRDRVVTRFYWIQFEGYLSPDRHYDYSKDESHRIQGLDFHVRARFGPTDQIPKPGSDFERVQRRILDAGYTLPAHMMNVRLVTLDETRSRELMVIYSEDLAPTGHSSADLQRDTGTAPAWDAIARRLIDRAASRVRFEK